MSGGGCNCCGKDPMFPPAGIPEFKPTHDFPTRYSNFHWWNEVQVESTDVCYKTIRRDELPIPPLHEERWRYPYRYTSAMPATMANSWLDKIKEMERQKAALPVVSVQPAPKKKRVQRMDPRDIRQAKGYETTSMDASLEPFLYTAPTVIIRRNTPSNLLTRTWAPKCAHTDFGEYVLRSLHPDYARDPRTRKRIQFNSRDSNREICVSLAELAHLDPNPQKKIRKKGFLFTQQYSTGHKNAKVTEKREES